MRPRTDPWKLQGLVHPHDLPLWGQDLPLFQPPEEMTTLSLSLSFHAPPHTNLDQGNLNTLYTKLPVVPSQVWYD